MFSLVKSIQFRVWSSVEKHSHLHLKPSRACAVLLIEVSTMPDDVTVDEYSLGPAAHHPIHSALVED